MSATTDLAIQEHNREPKRVSEMTPNEIWGREPIPKWCINCQISDDHWTRDCEEA